MLKKILVLVFLCCSFDMAASMSPAEIQTYRDSQQFISALVAFGKKPVHDSFFLAQFDFDSHLNDVRAEIDHREAMQQTAINELVALGKKPVNKISLITNNLSFMNLILIKTGFSLEQSDSPQPLAVTSVHAPSIQGSPISVTNLSQLPSTPSVHSHSLLRARKLDTQQMFAAATQDLTLKKNKYAPDKSKAPGDWQRGEFLPPKRKKNQTDEKSNIV